MRDDGKLDSGFRPGEIVVRDDAIANTQPLLGLFAPDEVRVIRGSRCRTVQDLFNEFSAALQFPLYFGHNWDAFDECMRDLGEWMIGTKTLTIVIVESTELLSIDRENGPFDTFARIIQRNVQESAAGREDHGENYQQPIPLAVVLVDSADKIVSVAARWRPAMT
ncbi:MAG: barstar family protein [Microcella sp.]|uniref:barstar family protein n=1 Tax=Microcella sp. TaxID=1913979 RepID=UPI0024C9D672|nr:barstar family protein [Microcella sp.]UYN83847.1 MAG: barstar family protein [Microcella sp.]